MGKTSKPSFSGGTIKVNGQTKAQTYRKKNNVISNYNMSEAEKRAYDYAQNSFADALPSVNVFDENTQKNLQSQLAAYALDGQKMVNSIYTPMLNNLKSDIASRFGNFDNSVFMDNLNSIEANRADAINNLAQDITAKRSELINNELSQRYSYLNFLQDIQNQTNSNIMNFINNSQANSNAGNNYNAQAAKSNSLGLGSYANLASGLLGSMGSYGPAASAALQIAKNYL